MKNIIKKHWRDFMAILCVLLFIGYSIYEKYHLGTVLGFVVLLVFLSYDRIKRIIVELNIRKIYGVEFGDIDKEEIVNGIKSELQSRGTNIEETEIEDIADITLNQIKGVAYKSRYYEEMVGYALKDLGESFQHEKSCSYGNRKLHIDYLVELDDSRVVGIEVVYTDRQYIDTFRFKRLIESIELFNQLDNFIGYAIITNAEVKDKDKALLKDIQPPITIIEKTVSPGYILSQLESYIDKIKKQKI